LIAKLKSRKSIL